MGLNDDEQLSMSNDARRFTERPYTTTKLPDALLPAMINRFGLKMDTLPPEIETREDQLLIALGSREWSTRIAAVKALGKLGERTSLGPLVAAVYDENDAVRAVAVQVLGRIGQRAPIGPLVDALHDSAWNVRTAAALALGQIGERAPIHELVEAIHDEDGSVCAAAAQALGRLGERAPIEPLLVALNDQEWAVREAAALALGNLGTRVPAEPLMRALQDKDASVREAAMMALEQTHPERLSKDTPPALPLPEQIGQSVNTLPGSSRVQENDVHGEDAAEHGGRGGVLPTAEADVSLPEGVDTNRSTNLDQQSTQQLTETPVLPSAAEPVRSPRQLFPVRQRGRRRMIGAIAATLLAASLVIASLATLPRFFLPATDAGIGGAFFVSSGQGNLVDNDVRDINDELLIDLHDIQAPASGKSYYGWLLADKGNLEAPGGITVLGKLPFNQGKINYLYQGNAGHTNLLPLASYFLITEEDASTPPQNPSPDHGAWRYSAEISRTPDPADRVNHYSLFDHLQHLLAKDPELEPLGLHGGLNFWCIRNVGRILDYAHTAQDTLEQKDTRTMHVQFVRILDYLDGPSVQTDVPTGTPVLVNAKYAQVPLLSSTDLQQGREGYLKHIGFHLLSIAQNPDASKDQKTLASQINESIKKVNVELEQVRTDAKLLVNMSDTQLLQPSSLPILNDMVTRANYAYNGQTDPVTRNVQKGVQQVGSDVQSLAAFDVEKYNP